MTTHAKNAKSNIAVAPLLGALTFCVGIALAAIALLLIIDDAIFGPLVTTFALSTLAFIFLSQFFETKRNINDDRQTRPTPKAWYRRYALIIGFISGFVVTFFTTGATLDIL